MAWLAVDKDGEEWVYVEKPVRGEELEYWNPVNLREGFIKLPIRTIKMLIGRELTWEDEPVELKEKEE